MTLRLRHIDQQSCRRVNEVLQGMDLLDDRIIKVK